MWPFSAYWRRISRLHEALGISRYAPRELPLYNAPSELVEVVGHVRLWMTKKTRTQYFAMRAAAEKDGVVLLIFRAFLSMEQAPAYSEHHTGRALDIGTTDCFPPTAEFERAKAFRWLIANAGKYGFTLSYPRGNPYGVAYQPWHWCQA